MRYTQTLTKLGPLTKKYGLKVVGGWAITQEHITTMIFDAPDPGATLKFMRDPETSDWQSHHIVKTRSAVTLQEAMKMLK